MVDVTFVIPVSPAHASIVDRAIASVKAQTTPCAAVVIEDTESRGPGWARNQGLAQVGTRFVSFLDADDTIAPNWAAHMLQAYQPNHYVYTDWWEELTIVHAPDCPWMVRDQGIRTFHVITSLLLTEDVRRLGGFDETLPGAEDTEFYRRLTLDNGVCGIRVPLPLFYYGAEGTRSKALHENHAMHELVTRGLDDRWRGKMSSCARCGGAHNPAIPVEIPQGTPLKDGYVWVQAGWDGNRRMRGMATNNVYDKSGNGKVLQVDARDQQADPNTFILIEVDRGYERRSEPEPDDMERVTFEPHYTETLADFFKAATGATDPPPPVYDPFAGQRASVGRERDLSKVYGKLGEMLV